MRSLFLENLEKKSDLAFERTLHHFSFRVEGKNSPMPFRDMNQTEQKIRSAETDVKIKNVFHLCLLEWSRALLPVRPP